MLAELLPELTTEVTGIESAFKDIQAANVGLEDQAAAVKDQFLRLTADFDNFKKRTVKEKQQLGETAKSKVFEAMLPALDNFDLAKANLKPESEEGEKIMSQYQGLYDGLMTILSNQGLTAVAAKFYASYILSLLYGARRLSDDSPRDPPLVPKLSSIPRASINALRTTLCSPRSSPRAGRWSRPTGS